MSSFRCASRIVWPARPGADEKRAVLETKKTFEKAEITGQHAALCFAAGQEFYNPSKFMLRDVKALHGQQQLRQDFEEALQRRKRANPDDSSDMTWMPFLTVPTNKLAWRSFVAAFTALNSSRTHNLFR
jgi:hypothetical protein